MVIDAAKYSCCGGHNINEDSVFIGNNLFIVADGLGGHGNGEEASEAAAEYISRCYHGNISDEEIFSLLEGANSEVCSLDNGSRTTVAAVFVNDEQLRFANVGDSRVYYFRKGKIIAMTKDHSVCQMAVDMGEMSFEDIRHSSDRSRLMKVLGNDSTINLKKLYEPIDVYDGDAFLICSDGFWEYVLEGEMEADLLKSESAEIWLRNMLKRQLLRAENKGDNYSAVCGFIRSDRKLPEAVTNSAFKSEATAPSIRTGILAAAAAAIFLAVVYLVLNNFGSIGGNSGDTNYPEDNEMSSVQTDISSETFSGSDETGSEITSEESTSGEITEGDNADVTKISSETAVCETEISESEITSEKSTSGEITESDNADVTKISSETAVCETEISESEITSEESDFGEFSEIVTTTMGQRKPGPGTGNCVIW